VAAAWADRAHKEHVQNPLRAFLHIFLAVPG